MSTTVHGPGETPETSEPEADPLDEVLAVHAAALDDWSQGQTAVRGEEVAAAADVVIDTDTGEILKDRLGLFDDGPYKREMPDFDGLASDKLLIAFGGSLELDPAAPEDIARFESLTLGKSVSLTVHGRVVAKTGAFKEGADGDAIVTGKASVKIDQID